MLELNIAQQVLAEALTTGAIFPRYSGKIRCAAACLTWEAVWSRRFQGAITEPVSAC